MAPLWRLLAKFGEVELPGPLLKTEKCPCGFCWCGKFTVERSPMSIFRTFISTKARESLKELLDGDGLNGDFGGFVPASTLNDNANQDLSGSHARTSVIGHSSAASEETRKTLESSPQREESLQASALDSEAASTGKTIEEDEDTCSSSKSRSSEINSQTSLSEGESSNSSTSNSDLDSQLSETFTSDDQSSSSLLSDSSGHETLNFTRQNNTLDSTCDFCFRRKKKAMQSTLLCVPNTHWAAKSECEHCEKASFRSSEADSNLSTSESAESPSDNSGSQKSDTSLIDQESRQNIMSNASIESKIGKNRVSTGGEPTKNHIRSTGLQELEDLQMDEDQTRSLPMDISFGDQNQVAEISQFSSASFEVPEQEASSGSSTSVVSSGGCQTADESVIGRTSHATKPDLSKEIQKFNLGPVNQEIVSEAENRDYFDMTGAGGDLSFMAISPADVCVNCEEPLSKKQTELGISTSSNGKCQGASGPLMYCPTCATCQIDLPNAVFEASENPVLLSDDSQDADNDELCDGDVDDSAKPKPTPSPKNKTRKSSRLSQKSISEVAEESLESSDDDDNSDDPAYTESGNESADSGETSDDGGDSDDEDNEVAASSHDLSDIQEQDESDEDEQTDSNPGGSRLQNGSKKTPNAKPKRRTFWCFECGERFPGTKTLNQHLREHDSIQPFKCGLCIARFETRKKYSTHLKSHKDQNGRFNCNQCEYSTQISSNIIRHLRIHSGGEKIYTCDDCGKAFNQLTHLTDHKRVHSGEKPYKCEQCNKSFNVLSNLYTHKRIHSDERPYECDVCGKAFNQLSNLTTHKGIHSGERPYKCDMCSESFKRAQHLKRHKRIHSGERPYECPKCAKTFIQKSHLQKHQKLVHFKKKANQHRSSQ